MSLCDIFNVFVCVKFLFLQAVVEQINIEGYWRTKRDILIPGIKRLLEASTFSEVMLLLRQQSDTTSIFKEPFTLRCNMSSFMKQIYVNLMLQVLDFVKKKELRMSKAAQRVLKTKKYTVHVTCLDKRNCTGIFSGSLL